MPRPAGETADRTAKGARVSVTRLVVLLGLLPALFLSREAFGGRAPINPRARAAMVARLKERAGAAKARATAYAKAHGIPVRVDTGRGVRELMDVRDGRPLYYITHNENAGLSTAADQVRSVYSADGAGLTVGIWDGGWVRHRHQEFGGRVTIQDFDLPATGDGLWGDYWDNTTMTGQPAASRVDPVIDFLWDNGNRPWGGGPKDGFSVSWSGHVLAQYDETYTFYMMTEADDGVRVWVDGVPLFDDWDSPVAVEHSNTIDLEAGERYTVTIDYREATGDAIAELRWSSPSTPKDIIPQAYLFSSWPTGWHGTHVAGTIAAEGVDSAAKGMAPKVGIDSYNWYDDYAEMAAAGASAPADGGIYLSNHSYGYLAGWNIEFIASRWEWRWSWYGPWSATPENEQESFFGQYEAETAAVDDVAFALPYYLICCSAGNERTDNPAPGEGITYVDGMFRYYTWYDPAGHPPGDGVYKSGYDTLAPWGGAKNVLSVGAVTDAVTGGARDPASGAMTTFSSWGPTDDGRIKPDVVANGYQLYSTDDVSDTAYWTSSGTSMSSPNATGSALLLQELYAEKFPGEAMRSSTLKALILHTADDLGRPGPDYCYGFGLMNAKAAADVIDSCTVAGDVPIIEDSLDDGENTSRSYTFWWDGATALRATLCWTDPAGAATSVDDDRDAKLVNDLRLKITTPDGEWLPYCLSYAAPDAPATRGVNSVDNVEQVYVNSSGTPGDCTVTVDYAGVLTGGAQDFGLVVTLGDALIAITDVSGPASVGTYEKVELAVTLANDSATKPYDPDPAYGGLDLWAEFTGPSGVWPVPVNGFYDGSEWRIRFSPDEVGAWSYTVTATDSRGTAVWTGGSFDCVASTHRGWVRVDDLAGVTDWDRLRHASGEVFFGVGHNTGWQYNVEQPPLADMAAQGENLLSFWMAVPWAEPAWASVREPYWDDRSAIESLTGGGLGNYNQAACDYIDGVVSRAQAAGVCLMPTIWSHGELRDVGHPWGAGWWDNNAYNAICTATEFFETDDGSGGDTEQWRLQKNYFRYLIARWGYSRAVAGWIAVCEMDGTTGYVNDSATAEAWCAEVGDYFRANDYWRLNSAGKYPMASSKTDFAGDYASWNPGFDLNTSDSYASQYNDIQVASTIASETQALRGLGLPSFHAEFGGDVRSGATEPLHLHNGIWAGLASGACMTPLTWTDGDGWPMLWTPPLPPSGDGLVGEYYSNMTLDGSADLTRTDPSVDFSWAGSPGGTIPTDGFSVRWTGHVLAQYDETYTFYVATGDDEGARLWVNGSPLVDYWATPGTLEDSGAIALSAGERYSITLEYFENSGVADAVLSWSCPSAPTQAVVPQTQLFSAPAPLAVNVEMRDHLRYLSQFARGLACLDDSALTDAAVGVDGSCEAWGMRTAGRGFAWIHDTSASPSLGGETFTVSGLDAGSYGVFWYDVWTSGTTYYPEAAPIVVDGTGILTVTVPTLSRPDIAVRFMPSPETPTPAVMSSVRARSVGAGALVEWTTASELENAGFDVLRRRAGVGGDFERVTPRPIKGRITAGDAKTYRWLDFARPGEWEYRVETISTAGVRERHGSGPDVTVTVRPLDAARSLGALARGAAGRLASGLDESRSRADSKKRRGELAKRPPLERPPSKRPRRGPPATTPGARILSSISERTGASPERREFRPPPGAVKIVTRGDGVFRVPASALGRKARRARFVTGGTESPPLAVARDGAWFFAPGYRDSYTDSNATFVVEGRDASGGRPSSRRPPRPWARGPAVTTARAVSRAETDGAYVIGLPSLIDPWVDPRFVNDSSGEVTVDLDAPGLAPGPAALRVAVCGYTEDARVSPDHELIVSLNGAAVARFAWDGRESEIFEVALPEGAAREGANTVGLLAPRNPEIPRGHGLVFDYVEIEHERRLSLADGPFALELEAGAGARVVEVDGGAKGEAPWVVEVDASGCSTLVPARLVPRAPIARFTAREGFAYYVAPAGAERSPEGVTRARVAAVEPGTDYVAVGPEEFRGPTAPLIELRRAEGMRVAYVTLGEAADTWGLGREGAAGIAALVRAVGPRYLLLVGDNAYDYRGLTAGDVDSMVPAFLSRPSALAETNADALYGDIDSDGAPDIPVGRLPVRTAGELANLIGKIVSHGITGSRPAGVLLAGRSGSDEDFAGASRRVAARFSGFDWTELYAGVHGDEAAIRAALARVVDAGSDLVVYQGHGAVSALGKGLPLLGPTAAAEWRSAPVVYLATCWGAFIQHEAAGAKSVAEALLRGSAGSPAVVGSTTPCAQWAQQMLLMDFLEGVIERGVPLGDALVAAQRRAAERASSAGPDAAASLMDVARFYSLLGDPAMGLAGPAKPE